MNKIIITVVGKDTVLKSLGFLSASYIQDLEAEES